MDRIIEAIFGAIMDGVSRLITARIAALFGIEEDTPAWRNLDFVIGIGLALLLFVAILQLLSYLAGVIE